MIHLQILRAGNRPSVVFTLQTAQRLQKQAHRCVQTHWVHLSEITSMRKMRIVEHIV